MADSKRGGLLTAFAVLFVLLAIEDFLKPFGLEGPTTGIVFFGHRLQGHAAYVGWIVGAFLLVYAFSIFTMRALAMPLAYTYGAYVVLNIAIFTLTYPPPTSSGELIFGVVYSILAILGAWIAVILLRRRRADLT